MIRWFVLKSGEDIRTQLRESYKKATIGGLYEVNVDIYSGEKCA